MKKKNIYLGLVLFCLGLCFAFTFDDTGFTWLWEGRRGIAMLAGVGSVVFFGLYFGTKNRHLA